MRRLAAIGLVGLVAGYVSLLGFPITGALVVVASLLALRLLRPNGVEAGIFLLTAGVAGAFVLGQVLINAWKCDYNPCISDSTAPTFGAYVVIAAVGATAAGIAVYRRRHSQTGGRSSL